jgi:hypothetical protein
VSNGGIVDVDSILDGSLLDSRNVYRPYHFVVELMQRAQPSEIKRWS